MKINDLVTTTDSTDPVVTEGYLGAIGHTIAGKLGVEGSREKAEQSIARSKFVNTFTSKFLSDLNSKVPQLKKTIIAAQQSQTTPQPTVAESFDGKLANLLNEQQAQTLITDYLYNKIITYMTGYTLDKVKSQLYQFCQNVQNEYMANRNPDVILRQIGELLFDVATIQKNQRTYASQPQEKGPEQIDSLSQEAINVIKNLSSRNNTYQVAAAALTQLRKTNPAAYMKLMSSVK